LSHAGTGVSGRSMDVDATVSVTVGEGGGVVGSVGNDHIVKSELPHEDFLISNSKGSYLVIDHRVWKLAKFHLQML